MELNKDTIVGFLHEQGRHDDAEKAQQELPDKVDHEQHADLLQKFGINPQDLLSKAKGLFGR